MPEAIVCKSCMKIVLEDINKLSEDEEYVQCSCGRIFKNPKWKGIEK